MIQIKAHEATETTWKTVATEAKQSCDGKVLTWNSKATTTEDACKQSCTTWGTPQAVQTNGKNKDLCLNQINEYLSQER
jgi:hypothetical protein